MISPALYERKTIRFCTPSRSRLERSRSVGMRRKALRSRMVLAICTPAEQGHCQDNDAAGEGGVRPAGDQRHHFRGLRPAQCPDLYVSFCFMSHIGNNDFLLYLGMEFGGIRQA